MNVTTVSYCFLFLLDDICTSSTAQGGGGSFKNGKPIGEVSWCDAKMAERTHWWIERWLCVSPFLSLLLSFSLCLSFAIYLQSYLSSHLPIYLSIHVSIDRFVYSPIYETVYLSVYPAIHPSLCVYLCIFSSVKFSLHLSFDLPLDLPINLSSRHVNNKTMLLDFCWQHQKRSNSARLSHFLQLKTSKTKQFCETSFKNGKLTVQLTASYQCVLRFFHAMSLKYCACHEKVSPGHTKCCTCHEKASWHSWWFDTPKCNPSQEISSLSSEHLCWRCLLYCACHEKCICADPLQISHDCHRFWKCHNTLTF